MRQGRVRPHVIGADVPACDSAQSLKGLIFPAERRVSPAGFCLDEAALSGRGCCVRQEAVAVNLKPQPSD